VVGASPAKQVETADVVEESGIPAAARWIMEWWMGIEKNLRLVNVQLGDISSGMTPVEWEIIWIWIPHGSSGP